MGWLLTPEQKNSCDCPELPIWCHHHNGMQGAGLHEGKDRGLWMCDTCKRVWVADSCFSAAIYTSGRRIEWEVHKEAPIEEEETSGDS